MRRGAWVALALTPVLGVLAFGTAKTWAVARELVDPPFYRAQPLARVEGTYRDLAAGQDGDPGGTWTSEAAGDLQVWRFRRPTPAPGVVLLLHGFGDDRWGTSPALKWFPGLDASIFTYRRRDDAMRAGGAVPPVTFGALEALEVVRVVHHLEATGIPRHRILLLGRSLGASVGLLALADLEREGRGPLAGIIWEGAPASSRSFAERLVRGPKDKLWHVLAPPIGAAASALAGQMGGYDPARTDLLRRTAGPPPGDPQPLLRGHPGSPGASRGAAHPGGPLPHQPEGRGGHLAPALRRGPGQRLHADHPGRRHPVVPRRGSPNAMKPVAWATGFIASLGWASRR